MRVTGSMVVVEHTFFLTMSRAMAALCQYTLVSSTVMEETSIILRCVSESSGKIYWVTVTYEKISLTFIQEETVVLSHRTVYQ